MDPTGPRVEPKQRPAPLGDLFLEHVHKPKQDADLHLERGAR